MHRQCLIAFALSFDSHLDIDMKASCRKSRTTKIDKYKVNTYHRKRTGYTFLTMHDII